MIKITEFVDICKKTQFELKSWLYVWLKKYYEEVISQDGFLYAKGTDNILLTAHMDTVHRKQCKTASVKNRNGYTIISSNDGIGGDDRCGIWMIMQIVEKTKFRPSILFCEDEEIGGVGSDKFLMTKWSDDLFDLLFMIELDRANGKDLVYYDDENYKFHDFCKEATGYKEAFGSFSDISNLCPSAMISGVNISCGYYKAHTVDEIVVWEEMENSIAITASLIKAGLERGEQFEYVRPTRNYYGYYGCDSWWKKYYENNDMATGTSYNDDEFNNDEFKVLNNLTLVEFFDDKGAYYTVDATTFDEAVGKLMQQYPNLSWNKIIDWECY